jgi:hypothetical protein
MPTAQEELDEARARGDIFDDADGDAAEAAAKAAADAEAAVAAKAGDKPKVDAALDEDDPDKPARKPVTIPKARFDEARRKDKLRIDELERQLAAGATKNAPPSAQQRIAALEEQSAKLTGDYAKALDDGDTKKAADLMTQIRQLDRDVVRIETASVSARDSAIAVEQVRLDMLIDTLEDKYPQLKDGSDDYDAELVEEIGDLRQAFEAKGLSSSEALKKAVKYALRDDGAGPAKQIDKDVDKAAGAADKAADKAAKLAADRRAEAVRRNLDTARRQPVDTGKAPGLDSHKAGGGVDLESVASMSDKDFDALPDATRRKLRGDYYAPGV